MELRQLEYFSAIVSERSITAAARRCGVSQPSASLQLQLLEEELGEPLVLRKPRGVEPTAAGKLLMEHARHVLAESRKLRDQFLRRREGHVGQLIFGVIPTVAPFLLPRILLPFREAFPRVDVQIREAKSRDLIQMLVGGAIEFAILSDVDPRDRKKWSLHLQPLWPETLLLAVPSGHGIAGMKSLPSPRDLAPENMIHLKDGHCLSERTRQVCRIEKLDSRFECEQLETALAMVAAGIGVAIVPEPAALACRTKGVVFRNFRAPAPERTITLLKRRAIPFTSPAEEFQKILKRFSPSSGA